MYNTNHQIVPVGVDGVVLHFECGGFKPEVIIIDNMTPSDGFLYHQIYSSPLTTNPASDGFIPAHDFKVLVAPEGKKNFTVAIQPVAVPTGREYVDVIVSDDPRYFRMFHQTNLAEVSITGGATEATLATRATEATLLLLKNKDFATQTTLAALLAAAATEATLATRGSEATLATRATEATLATLAGKDFATQTTLAALLAAAATEATLATRASEATLATRATEATLATLAGKDFATQTTLAALLAAAATEATLATRASEATLASLEGKDFATQTTLAAILAELVTANATLTSINGHVSRIP